MSEHMDLRHVMGVGIAITRGSAASLSFCYSLLLLTMCRNLITKIRELPLQQYMPLDSHVQFHKIVALTALFFSPIVFTLDKVVSLQTKYMELDILDTELLPSDVTRVKFTRPPNFKYLSGQWVRLSCTGFRANEYHSLTLTSAPHENYLSVHVKAQGPWTWKLRNYLTPSNLHESMLPKVRVSGPSVAGTRYWYKFEIAVMVGGGIGVTPYASIPHDLVFGTSTNRYSGVAARSILHVDCPSHRHFEWFIDVLRDVERKDVTNVLEIHIFITQFFHKFDLRTTMLVSKVGVFSCGPSALTKSVSSACETVNNSRKLPYFIHHYENF
ncbi:hypothetical protein HPB49_003278 [Dermacentor silvarum]|uniref:Uncharacterized protein n=1 Tax=Dermacentor silvarum TaxID=543639 RepID=A0ACB8DAG9_DERSI|nr:hypothetical protein HPB49_003278 [Dermacentor silvarum]